MRQYIQLTAGRGPAECARAVALIARELQRQFPSLELIDSEAHKSEPGCFMSVTFAVEARPDELAKMKEEWCGTVLYKATSNSFRPTHKRRNLFVGVNFISPVELTHINETDIRYETCRSGGKGGQNVNKVETTVRAIHVPSGISVRCSDERSQAQNKSLARERLLLKIHAMDEERSNAAARDKWENHDSLERGNPIKTFSGKL